MYVKNWEKNQRMGFWRTRRSQRQPDGRDKDTSVGTKQWTAASPTMTHTSQATQSVLVRIESFLS